MTRKNLKETLPLSVIRALKQLGEDISVARRRRRLTAELLAERALTSRSAVRRIERGDPSVSMGLYAAVLHVLGLEKRLAVVAAPEGDELGMDLERESLPKRVRRPR
ncbi:MAG: helix-turn-helix transcriptional regulator [Myxococcota bacterium]